MCKLLVIVKKLMDKNKILGIKITFTLVGAIGGFLYWKFVGCTNGTCAIKSVWYYSTLWGMAMGYMVGDLVKDFLIKREAKK
jgi:hypothetical protein